jgi:hypothetical protein
VRHGRERFVASLEQEVSEDSGSLDATNQ